MTFTKKLMRDEVAPMAERALVVEYCPIIIISAALKSSCNRFDKINGTEKSNILGRIEPLHISISNFFVCILRLLSSNLIIGF